MIDAENGKTPNDTRKERIARCERIAELAMEIAADGNINAKARAAALVTALDAEVVIAGLHRIHL